MEKRKGEEERGREEREERDERDERYEGGKEARDMLGSCG